MSADTIALPIPGQIRRHVLKNVKPKTQGERDLVAACVAGAKQLEANEMSPLNTIDLNVTNDALGVALDIARGWLDSDNGNNVMAAKSCLKFELEYEPGDPREIRHAIKMAKSLSSALWGLYIDGSRLKGAPDALTFDLKHMSRSSAGASGRVRTETLGWILGRVDLLMKMQDSSAVKRAAKKFIDTYTEPYEKTKRLINGYLGTGEDEDQAPEPAAEEPERKRLVVISCGGKKSDAPGKIPAEERYTGNYFNACRMAADVMDGPTMVLSAKYGLIPLTEEIDNYDVKWGGKGSIRLGTVRGQVEALGLEDAKVTVLGGERYVTAARQLWPDAEAPLTGGIGQQLKQLAGMYEGEALEDDETEEKPKGPYPYEWRSSELRNVMGLPSRYSSVDKIIWFGGKAGKANPEPGKWTKVKVIYTGEGRYDLTDVETGESVMMCTLVTKIHWAPGNSDKKFDQWRQKNRPVEVKPDLAAVEAAPPGGYEVPENFLELAEEGDTPQARAYWTRRCEEYRRTGK
ncbi:DUF6884 domain-containing protein [Streptomyces sp. NPDC001118]|uniref:DUF6884 domain-containing protein n=1 Tax=Streptomyces sp. NPDC001127 TaxID=3154377 RepID=UPI003332AD58